MSISSINSGLGSNLNNSQSDSIKALLSSVENQPTLLSLLSGDSTDSTDSTDSLGDILDLSDAGQSAADQLFQLLSSQEAASVQATVDTAGASVQQKLSSALSANGIDTSQEIDLQLDSNGNVVVSNDNPQSQQIEDTINNNPDLKKAVVQYLQFMQAMAPTMENSGNSQDALSGELDQLLSSLASGNGSQGTVTLAIQGNGFETSYLDSNNNSTVLSSSLGQ